MDFAQQSGGVGIVDLKKYYVEDDGTEALVVPELNMLHDQLVHNDSLDTRYTDQI